MVESTKKEVNLFLEKLPKGLRILGIDLGKKRIGLAISDTTKTIASPLEVMQRGKFSKDALYINSLVIENNIGGIVLGYPINMSGDEGKSCQSAREYGKNLERTLNIPVAFWDERLSSVAVNRTLDEAGASWKRKSELVDKMAASYILQGFLDYLKLQK